MATTLAKTGKSRAERKAARAAYIAAHPILSGAVRIVAYKPSR